MVSEESWKHLQETTCDIAFNDRFNEKILATYVA